MLQTPGGVVAAPPAAPVLDTAFAVKLKDRLDALGWQIRNTPFETYELAAEARLARANAVELWYHLFKISERYKVSLAFDEITRLVAKGERICRQEDERLELACGGPVRA